ncbi:MAG: L-threonine 3-dehydrogenase [Planctomycetota bacterium]
MAEDMLAVMKTERAQGATVTRAPIPKIENPHEVLIKIKASSICGTDAHIYFWDEWSQGRIKPPMIFGHECAGEVVEVGSLVTRVKVGDYVSPETHIPCGYCPQCLTGKQHICHNLKILGVDVDGVFAEYVVVPESVCWKNDPSLPLEIACIQEPFGNAMYTVSESDVGGKQVCIIGDGPIAAFAVGIARAFGAAPIYCVGKHDVRIEILKKMGADVTLSITQDKIVESIMDATHGYGVDVVLEMTGQQTAIDWGLQMVKKGGTFTAFGIPTGKIQMDLSGGVVFKGANIIGINGRMMFDTWFKVANILGNKRVDPSPVITHRFPLKEFEAAMKATKNPKRDCGKAVLLVD